MNFSIPYIDHAMFVYRLKVLLAFSVHVAWKGCLIQPTVMHNIIIQSMPRIQSRIILILILCVTMGCIMQPFQANITHSHA